MTRIALLILWVILLGLLALLGCAKHECPEPKVSLVGNTIYFNPPAELLESTRILPKGSTSKAHVFQIMFSTDMAKINIYKERS